MSERRETVWPCGRCGKERTREEGGPFFAVCAACWTDDDIKRPPGTTTRAERQVAAVREVLALLKERADIYDRAASEGACDETAYREVSIAFSALRRALEAP